VRELENIIEHAFALCRIGVIELEHLPARLRGETSGSGLPAGLTLGEMEKLLIRDALRRTNGNRAAAARELIEHPALRRSLSERSRALVDGRGAQRVATALLASRAERRAVPKPARIPSGDRPMYPSAEGLS